MFSFFESVLTRTKIELIIDTANFDTWSIDEIILLNIPIEQRIQVLKKLLINLQKVALFH